MHKTLGIIGLILSFCNVAQAREISLGYGVGVFGSGGDSFVETKILNITYRDYIWKGIYWQGKLGLWTDSSGQQNRTGSGYGSVGAGLKVDLSPIELRSGWGLAAITSPDGYLGGVFPQFNGEVYLGFRDKNGNAIGVQYEHISSAGILTPNQGRDFITIQIGTEW